MSMQNTIERYTSGEYLAQTGGQWHLQDSPSKAEQVVRMLDRNGLKPDDVCEIGCGAGGILHCLEKVLPEHVPLVGYDISPQAHELSLRFTSERLQFICDDAFADERTFDVALIMDVVEHVEDCFGFLRQARDKGEYKIYHYPLEISCLTALRESRTVDVWKRLGHIHRFTLSTALESLRYTGHEILDHFLTYGALHAPNKPLRTRVANIPRRAFGMFSEELTRRIFGGSSVLILAR